jgi:hypothetical protein
MTGSASWPTYPVGPKASVFALGVVILNYAQLEFAIQAIFATVLGISLEEGSRFKINGKERENLIKDMLPARQWPQNVNILVFDFVDACEICRENRNKLARSNLVSAGEATLLYKNTRQGRVELSNPTLSELRQAADDMKIYCDYGLYLSNAINFNLLGIDQFCSGKHGFEKWPEKPRLAVALEYSSEPREVRT